MGHKVHPIGFRLGVIRGWESRWYADRNYKDLFQEDRQLREAISKRLANAAIARIEIERIAGTQLALTIHTAKPGVVIGRSGENVDRLRQQLEAMTKKKIKLSILEIRNPDVVATLVSRSVADQLEKRISFRRAMKQAVQKSMRQGAKGIKIVVAGRLGGAEIARTEKEQDGSVPLQTLRADIDYGLAEAHTTYGVIGVKVWIYHGDVLPSAAGEPLGAQRAPAPVPQPGERFGGRGERGGGERRPRGGERGGSERGGSERGGERGGDERAPRRTPGVGTPGAERGPRPVGQGIRGGGSGATRAPRAPRTARAQSSGPVAGGTRETPGPITEQPAGPVPHGVIPTEEGPALPSGGPATPAPTTHEVPAPAADATQNPGEPARREPPDEPEGQG